MGRLAGKQNTSTRATRLAHSNNTTVGRRPITAHNIAVNTTPAALIRPVNRKLTDRADSESLNPYLFGSLLGTLKIMIIQTRDVTYTRPTVHEELPDF